MPKIATSFEPSRRARCAHARDRDRWKALAQPHALVHKTSLSVARGRHIMNKSCAGGTQKCSLNGTPRGPRKGPNFNLIHLNEKSTFLRLGPSWAFLGRLRASWWRLGGIPGASWAVLGDPKRLWRHLGLSWKRLGGVLEGSWRPLGRSWAALGRLLGGSWVAPGRLRGAYSWNLKPRSQDPGVGSIGGRL